MKKNRKDIPFDRWWKFMQPEVTRLCNIYSNRVYSHSDIKQECRLKLLQVLPKVKDFRRRKQVYCFLRTCLQRCIIDKATKFISAEGRSKNYHNKLRKTGQLSDRGGSVAFLNNMEPAEDRTLEIDQHIDMQDIRNVHPELFDLLFLEGVPLYKVYERVGLGKKHAAQLRDLMKSKLEELCTF